MTIRVLLTNDDGYDAAGLSAVRTALIAHGLLTVTVAPRENRSATGRRVTVAKRIALQRMNASDGHPVWALDGTPADCVRVGVLADMFPSVDVVLSGVNHGVNLGDDVSYSGTVAAAAESALLRVPSIAVSQAAAPRRLGFLADRPTEFLALDFVAALTAGLANGTLADGLFLNVNVPAGATSGPPVTAGLGRRTWRDVKVVVHESDCGTVVDPWASDAEAVLDEGTDFAALHAGRIAVTPMSADHGMHGVGTTAELERLVARAGEGHAEVRDVP